MPRALLVVTGVFHLGGGIAKVNRLVVRTLAEAGYRLDICALLEDNTQVDCSYTLGVDVCYRVFRGSKYSFSSIVWRSLVSGRYDLVFCDHVNLASILAPLKYLPGVGYAVWLHGAEVFPPQPDLEGRLGLRSASKCLSSSEFTRRKVLDRFPGLPVQACDLALDPVLFDLEAGFQPIESYPELRLEAIDGLSRPLLDQVILCVGRLDPLGRYKGQGKLLGAFPAIHAAFPRAQLVIAGGGEDYSYYQGLANALPLHVHPAIFLPGHVSSQVLKALYSQCCLFAMPSQGEGFGLVYLEAMAYAKACLGCLNDAASCVIQDGLTGSLVPDPVDPDSVAERIIQLLADPVQLRRMGQAGYDLLRARYLFPSFRQRFWQALAG
jgi:glycosyltransferase involved in cell wall biosynthesis